MKTLVELRKMEPKKILEELEMVQQTLFKLKFEVKNGQFKGTNQIRDNQKQVARIKTLLRKAAK